MKIYGIGLFVVVVVDDVLFDIFVNCFIVLLGLFGSGKMILFNLFGGIDCLMCGVIMVVGQWIDVMCENVLVDFCVCYVGFVFQLFNLLFVFSVFENVEYLLILLGVVCVW